MVSRQPAVSDCHMMIEYTLPRSHAPSGSKFGLRCRRVDHQHNKTQQSQGRNEFRDAAVPAAAANRRNDCGSRQNSGVTSDNRQRGVDAMQFPAVHSSYHDIADGICGD